MTNLGMAAERRRATRKTKAVLAAEDEPDSIGSTFKSRLILHLQRPALGHSLKFRKMFRPVMQGGWIPISSVRPYQCMDFRVNPNLAEQGAITKWTKQFALQ